MSIKYVVPPAEAVKSLLGIIFGDEVTVGACETPEFNDHYTATFLDRDDQLVALCHSDIEFVAYSGSALSMIPLGAAEDMIADRDVSESIVGNFHEVMNICSQLLMCDGGPHLRLDKTFGPGQCEDASDFEAGAAVASMRVDVPRYGTGTLSFRIS